MKRSAHPKGRSRREAAAESNVIAQCESGTGVPPVSRAGVPLVFPQTDAWGLDLSGTETGAGGVGGLLFAKLHSTAGSPVLAPCHDGNGNIMAYLDCATGQTLARYEYDPFGKLLLKEEDTRVAGRLHHQFSTKYADDETGLSYYGYRYCAPELGRWVNRDPIGERGGINLYGMLANRPCTSVDVLGQGFWSDAWSWIGQAVEAACRCGPIDAGQIRGIAWDAENEAKRRYPIDDTAPQDERNRQQQRQNAFRHCLGACNSTHRCSDEDAQQAEDIHEKWRYSYPDSAIDDANNAIGNQLGQQGRNCEEECAEGVENGLLFLTVDDLN